MKKTLLSALFTTLFVANAWAIDDQLIKAIDYSSQLQKNIEAETIVATEKSPKEEQPYYQSKVDLHVGKTYNEIKMLQKQWGMEETGLYSEELHKFVKEAQTQKGLNPTGIIDFNTWFILYNQPKKWRLEAVNEAIKNWSNIKEKDLPKENNKMVIVNIPSMMLHVYDKSETGEYTKALSMKVVVGSSKYKTPLKDLNIVSLKYNPTWTATNNIVKRSAFNKKGEVNFKWLEKNDITIYDKNNEIIAHEDLVNHNFKELRFIQPAGDGNSLGLLKFETNSKDNIYLHDTNAKNYFNYNVRAYSSGCIRVEDYSKLASYLLGKDKEYISKQVAKNKTFWEKLKSVPVYFDNSRVSFEDDGTPHFFAKIY